MFDEKRFRAAIALQGKSLRDVAASIGVNPVTLYRKMTGQSDFTRAEVATLSEYLQIADVSAIFFAPDVT